MSTNPLKKSPSQPSLTDLPPLGMDSGSLARGFLHYFNHTLGRDKHSRSSHYPFMALALTVRDRLMERWKNTRYAYEERDCKRVYYLSLEYLIGRSLSNAMLNLGLADEATRALHELGVSLEELSESEQDAGLGNGGLGRLAACFLDSCATLQLPVRGYGIRYQYGMFRQRLEGGYQVEEPDHWLRNDNPWELERPEYIQRVHFGGRSERYMDGNGHWRMRWVETHDVLAIPYDVPVPGYRNDTVNTLRLWSAAATDEFDLGEFNAGAYTESVEAKNAAENITMVLYPNDASECGKELRLRQQYFLASASLKDVLRRWVWVHGEDFTQFAEKNCFQLNDTHPSCAVAELMRLLMDEHGLGWDEAWSITSRTMAYTNHTLLPEALEKWPVRMFGHLLPRLLEIIFEINSRFLVEVKRRWPGDVGRLQRMSIIEEGHEPQIRMAYLAVIASFSVNGVAALHSRLLKDELFADFHEMWPHRFNNKTNGVTQRRWLAACNPDLRELINETIGEQWTADLEQLRRLRPYADDPSFRDRWRRAKRVNKERLAELVWQECGVVFHPDALFDVHVKRIHEYKRQLLNTLHLIHLYDRIKRGDVADWTPRCVLIAGKAAPGYAMAKLIIKLINNVAALVNSDPEVGNRLKAVFCPNYRVSAMEIICPGTDLSEQISTAGKEASGTGNMKFMMNGAITMGTYDGANIEILEEVGTENFFLFGLTAEQVSELRGNYDPGSYIHADDDLARVMRLLESGHFEGPDEQGLFQPIVQSIRDPHDPWLTAADFRSFVDAQRGAAAAFREGDLWARMSILNTASSGRFSSDRTMLQYNAEIWNLDRVPPLALAGGITPPCR